MNELKFFASKITPSISMNYRISLPDGYIYEGVGHNSWINAYEESELIEWLISK